MATILLIWIPAATSLSFGSFTAWLCTKLPRHWARLPATCLAIFLLLLTGAWAGVLVSCEVNRVIFNWKVLSQALPSGIYLWYGFGPGLTPQFASYWIYVRAIKLAAWPLLTALTWLAWRYRLR